jgi:hypothetical protein
MSRIIPCTLLALFCFQLGLYLGKKQGIRLAEDAIIELLDKRDAEAKWIEL